MVRALADVEGLVCLWGDWADGSAVITWAPQFVVTDAAALATGPQVIGVQDDGVVAGGWFGRLGYDAATHNPYLEETLVRYDNLATRIWCLFLDRLPDLAGHVGEHSPLLQAIVAGEPDKAAQLSADHVAHFEQAIRAAI